MQYYKAARDIIEMRLVPELSEELTMISLTVLWLQQLREDC
jgi:hypothetical protein